MGLELWLGCLILMVQLKPGFIMVVCIKVLLNLKKEITKWALGVVGSLMTQLSLTHLNLTQSTATPIQLPQRRNRANSTSSISVKAGLPNIKGLATEVIFRQASQGFNSTTGAFSNSTRINRYWDSNAGNSYQGDRYQLRFDASLSNSIYGNSGTVTPKSTSCMLILKY